MNSKKSLRFSRKKNLNTQSRPPRLFFDPPSCLFFQTSCYVILHNFWTVLVQEKIFLLQFFTQFVVFYVLKNTHFMKHFLPNSVEKQKLLKFFIICLLLIHTFIDPNWKINQNCQSNFLLFGYINYNEEIVDMGQIVCYKSSKNSQNYTFDNFNLHLLDIFLSFSRVFLNTRFNWTLCNKKNPTLICCI